MKIGRKGLGFADLSTIGMVLLVTGLSLGIGIYVQSELGKTMASSSTVTNESINFATNDTWYSLAYPMRSVSLVTNETATGTYTVGSDYYTTQVSGTVSQVKIYANATVVVGTYNVTYGAYSGTQYTISQNSTNAIAQLSAWLPIIAIVAAAGIILTVLASAFAMRREDGGV